MLGMTIQAAHTRPSFGHRPSITADQLRHVQDPCVIHEGDFLDDDGVRVHCYTVGGFMDGRPLGGLQGGVTVGGEVILITDAPSREAADWMACSGLQDTIDGLHSEEAEYQEAHAAMARLSTVSPVVRVEKATASAADMSDAFVEDAAAIRKLRGDDIALSGGGMKH